jgi:hypothetical protein
MPERMKMASCATTDWKECDAKRSYAGQKILSFYAILAE